MIQIRQGIYETNSSSVYTLIIKKDGEVKIPNFVWLMTGQYGWENDEVYDKMEYIWTYLAKYGSKEDIKSFINWLYDIGVGEIEVTGWPDIDLEREPVLGKYDGIDHGRELPFRQLCANNYQLLKQLLFCDESKIFTGNDNGNYSYGPMPSSADHEDDYCEAMEKWQKEMEDKGYVILEKGN